MKILIIRLSAIGDIVWTTPVIRCVKKQIPEVELHFCTKKQYQTMLIHNPYIDKLHTYEGSLKPLIASLRAERFDYIIDLHRNIRTTFIKFQLNVKAYTYNKLSIERWLFIKFKINRMPKVHVADRYLDTVKPLGVANDNEGLDYFIPPKDEIDISIFSKPFSEGYVALVIGATEWTKKLPLEKLIELCEKIPHPIILVGGKEDMQASKALSTFFQNHPSVNILDACGIYTISQSASIVKQALYVVGHDTGLTHIAAAFKQKIFAIFGSTSPLGFSPYQTEHLILENHTLTCRPCSKSGRSRCPKGHFKCMRELPLDIVFP